MRNIILLLILMQCATIGVAQGRNNVELLGHWFRDDLPINFRNAYFCEAFGFVNDGVEYGVIGSTIGTHFIAIPPGPNPILEETEFIPGPQQGFTVNHRDYDVLDHYLFAVGDQAPALLQVIDFSYLPDTAMVVYSSDSLFSTAHNIRIDRDNRRAYACGPDEHALIILDIDDPLNPQFLLEFNAVPYVHDCYVRDNIAWLNCGGDGLYIYDFSDVNAPLLLGTLTEYPFQGYNHQGWLNSDGTIYAFADESMDMEMKICDTSDLTDIQVLDTFSSENDSTLIPHNLYIIDDLIYVSHYFDGLQIFDISNPSEVERVAWYDTSEEPNECCNGMWGVYPFLPSKRIVCSDRQNGLFVFRVDMDSLDPAKGQISVGPNPGHGMINLDLIDVALEQVTVEIFDSRGRLCKTVDFLQEESFENWATLDISHLVDGYYSLKFSGENFSQVTNYIKVSE